MNRILLMAILFRPGIRTIYECEKLESKKRTGMDGKQGISSGSKKNSNIHLLETMNTFRRRQASGHDITITETRNFKTVIQRLL